MIVVGSRELRQRLSHYLDLLEQGQQIAIMRHGDIVGHLKPTREVKQFNADKKPRLLKINGQEITFRRFGLHENPEPIRELNRRALEAAGTYRDDARSQDLDNPANHYESFNGEFWVGQLNNEIVATAAFKMHFNGDITEAELKRLHVKPELQNQPIGAHILKLIEKRAGRQGFKKLILDVTTAPGQGPARQMYREHGYQEMHRVPGESFDVIYLRKAL